MNLSKGITFARECAWPRLAAWLPRRERPPVDVFAPGGLRMTCFRAWPHEQATLASWHELASRCQTATAFHTPDWQLPLFRQAMSVGSMRLIGVFSGSRALAILPLQQRGGNCLETIGSTISDYLDPLVDPAHEETAWRAIFEMLRCLPDCANGSVVLHNVRDDAACRFTLGRIATDEGYGLEDVVTGNVARVALPATWDGYLASLSAHDRKECRRKLRKAETQADATLATCDSADQAPARLEHVFQCMESSGGSKGTKCRWIYRRVFESASDGLMRRGIMRVQTLRLAGKPAAGIISFRSAVGTLAWGAGYDPAQSAWSPGVVSFAMAIRDAISRGERVFDFLRGEQRYKYDLGAVDHPLHQLTLTPRRAA